MTELEDCHPEGKNQEDKGGEDESPQLWAGNVQGANRTTDAAEGATEWRDQRGWSLTRQR
jgi:hypothetical protein